MVRAKVLFHAKTVDLTALKLVFSYLQTLSGVEWEDVWKIEIPNLISNQSVLCLCQKAFSQKCRK